jgi:SAM-dependent methyltransferase
VLDSGVLARHVDPKLIEYPESGHTSIVAVEDASFWFQNRNRAITAVLRRYPPPGPIWDVGAGNGFQARHLEREGYPVVVVEPGPDGCANARGRGVGTVIQSTLEALFLPSGSLAALAYFDVLEHLESPGPLLEESLRVLRAGGRIYLTVPAYNWLWSHEDVLAQHKRRYTAGALRELLQSAGLDIEYLSYYCRPLLLPIFLLRTLPYRLLRRKAPAEGTTRSHQHAPPAPARAVLDHLLARECRVLENGSERRFGASLICVAHRP